MAVPKKKVSKTRRDQRRANQGLNRPTYVENPDTGELHRPHHIDLKTGLYRGRQVLDVEEED